MLSTRFNQTCFALVDCNNFFVSCERIFNPRLINKPTIVLSSNDGCVVARSNEAKLLGIKMGQPYFQIEKLCRQNHVHIFSSNFELYGDISKRVMTTLFDFCLDSEIYSIDEAFLRLDKMSINVVEYAKKIKETIWKNIGIPVSIGIAPTKTLAKMASHLAKQNLTSGIYDLRSENAREIILQTFPVEEIWGIGKQTATQLHYSKIHMTSQLCATPSTYLKKRFGVMMMRIINELNGISCLSLEEVHSVKNIMCSRSFGKPVTTLSDLLEAVSTYCANACKKARLQKIKAQGICVYLRTSLFNKTKPFYSASDQKILLLPSNDTVLITTIAHDLLKKLFKSNYDYQKVGVILLNLIDENIKQNDLFENKNNDDNKILMNLLDVMNEQWGKKSLFLAAEGTQKLWSVKSARRSPRYTTQWNELLLVL
ncbi:MAG: hypothetical protein A3E81_01900 [Gammaproteobacteria bacterium RIFCSPHIGHO2_12_FULL_36_30]|nr:MAG: hypothetical protein A3E81_01900 [Gammaproteobacteria bacterium RIFCSPHIGHO2_12_FULL_36_30]